MKKVKRLIGYMLCLSLVVSCISGCGGFAGKRDEELLMSAVKNINNTSSFEMDMKMSGEMTMGAMGMYQTEDMNMDMKSVQLGDPVKSKITMKVISDGTTEESECYVQKEGDKYVTYNKTAGEWSKVSLGDLDSAMSAASLASMQNQLAEDVTKYIKKDDKEEGDKTYLVYDYKVSVEEMKSLMNSSLGNVESLLGEDEKEEVMEMMNEVVAEMGDFTMTVLIDRESESIYRIELPMTDIMNNLMNAIIKKEIAEDAESSQSDDSEVDLDTAFDNIKMEVSDMNLVVTYSNIGSAHDFSIPQEALDAEEVSVD